MALKAGVLDLAFAPEVAAMTVAGEEVSGCLRFADLRPLVDVVAGCLRLRDFAVRLRGGAYWIHRRLPENA